MKRTLPVIILVIAAGGGLWWYFGNGRPDDEHRLTLYGNVEIRDAHLAFNEREYIAEVLVEEGDTVEKGQVLARLDKDRLNAAIAGAEAQLEAREQVVKQLERGTRPQQVEQARAEVAASEARLENARLDLERVRSTTASGASPAQALDDAQARYRVEQEVLEVRRKALDLALAGPREEEIAQAKASRDAAAAELRLLNVRLEESGLRAPAPGVVQSRILEPGEMAAPNRPVLTLALTDPKWVRTYVSEPNLGRIRQGLEATVYSDSFPDKTYKGWVGFISSVAEFTPKTVETTDLRPKLVYETRVYVEDPNDELRLGMPVTVTLPVTPSPIGENDDGVRLPDRAAPGEDDAPGPGEGAGTK